MGDCPARQTRGEARHAAGRRHLLGDKLRLYMVLSCHGLPCMRLGLLVKPRQLLLHHLHKGKSWISRVWLSQQHHLLS